MVSNRREFMEIAGTMATAAALAAIPSVAQTAMPGQFRTIKALAFDAYGTLFDVFSVTALCEQLFPGKGNQLAQIWRAKQLQYSLMRSLMGRHRDFWGLTEDGLVWSSKNLQLELTADKKKQLMDAYLSLAAFPDVKPGLEALRQQGVKLAILSNGEPKMLEAAAKSAGIRDLLDDVISVEEVKVFKVSPRVYNLAPERLKVSNPELGFIYSVFRMRYQKKPTQNTIAKGAVRTCPAVIGSSESCQGRTSRMFRRDSGLKTLPKAHSGFALMAIIGSNG